MKHILFLLVLAVLPVSVFAQATDVFGAEAIALDFLESLYYFFWFLAVALFFFGIVRFIGNANDPTEREKGKQIMVWGIISFVVLLSLWGFVALILEDTLGIFSANVPYVDKNGVTH